MQVNPSRCWQRATWATDIPVIAGVSITNSPTFHDNGFNISHCIGDNATRVNQNRAQLARETGLVGDWLWLQQNHSTTVIDDSMYYHGITADALISRTPYRVAVVMTADCVPILITTRQGGEVAAIHAGWRGIFHEIIEKTIRAIHASPATLFAWIGPCATQKNYEVDLAFYQRFVRKDIRYASFFSKNRKGHYLADLPGMARYALTRVNLLPEHITGGNQCSIAQYCFFSHRRNGAMAGRMASFITPTDCDIT